MGSSGSVRRFLAFAADSTTEQLVMLGIGILGRAAYHAWRLGDMTDEEAGDFVDEVGDQLLADLADAAR